jgi:hypothetical protein
LCAICAGEESVGKKQEFEDRENNFKVRLVSKEGVSYKIATEPASR